MGRAPDFICIGAAKAGTTWLYDALANSPGYWMPPVKELNYFGHPKRNPKHLERVNHLDHIVDLKRREWVAYFLGAEPRDDNWYRTLFAPAGDLIAGDISPAYGRIGAAGIEHARRVAPDVKIVMFIRNPADRDLSHLVHIATGRVFGTYKLGAVLDAIARSLHLRGSTREQRRQVERRFQLKRQDTHNMERLLAILGDLIGRRVSLDDVADILGKRITLADVQAARTAPAFCEQRRQSMSLERWAGVFGGNFAAFLYDDLLAQPEQLFARITGFLGRRSQPDEPSLLHRISNPNAYRIDGIEELRAELALECAAEREALRNILGDRLLDWQ